MYRRAFINLSYSENAYCLLDTKCYHLAHLHYTFPFSSLSPMSHCYIISAALFKYNFISLFIDWFLAALGLCCCVGFSLVVESLDDSLAVWCVGFLLAWLLLLRLPGSRAQSSVVTGIGFCCSVACGILPNRRLNLYLLHWQVNY